MQMELTSGDKEDAFREAFDKLTAAIDSEAKRSRITVHPFTVPFSGTARYLELGGQLTAEQHSKIAGYLTEARYRFSGEAVMATTLRRLDGSGSSSFRKSRPVR